MTEANRVAIKDEDLAEVQKLTPMIANLTKNIRVEEERLKELLTRGEAQARFETYLDTVIDLVWEHAPDAAPTIVCALPAALRGAI